MIDCQFDASSAGGRIVLRPNRSWTWRANLCLAGTLLAVSGTIGAILAVRGAWTVLPFAMLQGAAVLAGLYCCVRRTYVQEVLTFSPEFLLVERGIRRPWLRRRFQRYFTRFLVHPADHRWYRRRIAVRCRDQELEIGSFLTSEEQDDLIRALREMIQRLEQPSPQSRERQ
ncbi:MAG TPA: DUF2244 domain-containing protein [Pseudomonadales bacterium]